MIQKHTKGLNINNVLVFVMSIEVNISQEDMDNLINTNTGQIILDDRFGWGCSIMNDVKLTDGSRVVVREPIEVLECYFEPLKVTIYEDGVYVQYLWTDQKIINIAMMAGHISGEKLRDDYKMFHRYVVARW